MGFQYFVIDINYRIPLNALPALNLIRRPAGTVIFSPVRGLAASRSLAARKAEEEKKKAEEEAARRAEEEKKAAEEQAKQQAEQEAQQQAAAEETARQAQQQAEQQQQQVNTYYPNCTAAKAAGAAPLYRDQPGYSTKLDRDGDGVACEK